MQKNFLIRLYNRALEYLGSEKKVSHVRAYGLPRPRILFFAVTSRCNFNCPHCLRKPMDENKALVKDLPIPIFETVLKEGKGLNFNTVVLVGGEPILHPQFPRMIELIRQYDYRFHIISNGWLYEEYWEALGRSKNNLVCLSLSLDGATAEVHDNIRDKKGSFDRVIEAINFYRGKEANAGIKFLLSKQNYHQIDKMVKFCLRRKIKQMTFITEIPFANSDLSEEGRIEAAQKILALRRKFRRVLRIQMAASFFQDIEYKTGVHFCSALDGQKVFVDFNGGMLFCPDIYSKCENKPLIQEVGFRKSYLITLETINELKKKRLDDLLNNPKEADIALCDYCDRHIEDCLNLAKRNII